MFAPSSCKGLRNFKPTPIVSSTMIGPHTGALTFVTNGVQARGRTLLLHAIGLNDIQLPKFSQCPVHKVIKPSLGQLPILTIHNPNGTCPPSILEPRAICCGVRQSDPEPYASSGAAQDYRYLGLVPNTLEVIHGGHSRLTPFQDENPMRAERPPISRAQSV
jgi:hypothetical protein